MGNPKFVIWLYRTKLNAFSDVCDTERITHMWEKKGGVVEHHVEYYLFSSVIIIITSRMTTYKTQTY